MALFVYKGKRINGEVFDGKMEATSHDEVLSFVRQNNGFTMDINEITEKDMDKEFGKGKKIKIKDLTVFTRQFYSMVNAGISIVVCIDMLRKTTNNKRFEKALNSIYENIQKGISLSESIKQCGKIFPYIFYNMVEVGEMSGRLDMALERLAIYLDGDSKFREKLKNALTYPLVIACIAGLVITFMMAFIVPKFVENFKVSGKPLPLPTQILLDVSNYIKNPILIITVIVTIYFLTYLYKKLKTNKKISYELDSYVLRIPLFGNNLKKILAARFARGLTILMQTGVPIVASLEIVEKLLDNAVMSNMLEKVREEIKMGKELSVSLDATGIFPPMVIQMIKVGEESGTLDKMVEKIAEYYEEELENTVSKLVTMIEPLMIVLIAVVVGAIVIAMILPILTMNKNIGR